MYEAFYGLKERPFNLTPDPKYLYLSDKHKEAFAHLLFGIKHRSGFVMVTGEIGTGKTTICRNLLRQIESDTTNIAFVFNPPLNPVELIKKINVEFGISSDPDNALELTEILNKFLLEQASAGKNCVLVIDEAQNLSPQVLEQVRLLSNLETETDKLLQIVLIGQPELGEKLALHELRQLNQRITARYHLKALSEHETLQYVAYRLHVAGGGRRKIQFSKAAIKTIFRCSGGTPRVINAICDRALLIGYTKEAINISAAIVKQAAREIRGEKVIVERPLSGFLKQLLPNPSVALIALVALFGIWYIGKQVGSVTDQAKRVNDVFLPPVDAPAPSNAVEAKAEPPNAEAEARIKEELRAEMAKALAEKIAPGALVPAGAVDDSEKALAEALDAATPEDAGAAAGDALLKAWGLSAAQPALAENNPADAEAFFERNGLSAESLRPGLEQLIAIDLPALVRVKQGQKELWAALVSTKDNQATLVVGKDKRVSASVNAFKNVYLAEAVVPWKDPAPNAAALSVGRGGSAVGDLKNQLRQLGRLDASNKGEQYDQDVARAISRIQAETGLAIDGVAGRQVRMVMSAWAGTPGTPRLSGALAAAPTATVATAAAPAPKPAAKPAPKPESPATTPLPTPEQMNKAVETPAKPVPDTAAAPAAKPETPQGAVVKVQDLPKPDAPAEAAAPAPPLVPRD